MSAEAVLAAARLLWPAPATVTIGRTGPGQAEGNARRLEFVLVPSAADPRLVVPLRPLPAAAAVARSHAAPGSWQAAARTALMATAFASGAGHVLLRDRLVVDLPEGAVGLDEHLSDVLGRTVVIGLRLGPPRANRKPVLQVVTLDGQLVAYAKLGVSPLTDALVTAEGEALARLGTAILGDVRVPEVLHAGTWQGHPLLVQAALPVRRSSGPDAAARITRAMVAVAGSAAGSAADSVALADLPWWERTHDVVRRLPVAGPAAELASAGDLLTAFASRRLPAGAWHGDWNPGNCAVVRDRVLVWDWERYETGVPAGFDALHLCLQSAIGSGADPSAAAGRMMAEAAELLAPFGVAPVDARLVGMLYLWGLGARYAKDDQVAAGAAVGRLETWLLPILHEALSAESAASAQPAAASARPAAASAAADPAKER